MPHFIGTYYKGAVNAHYMLYCTVESLSLVWKLAETKAESSAVTGNKFQR